MASQAGQAFFKNTPVAVTQVATPPRRPANRLVGVRILPDHPMSIADSYLYTYGNGPVGESKLNSFGGLEVGLGSSYTPNVQDLPHVHTGAIYTVKGRKLYKVPSASEINAANGSVDRITQELGARNVPNPAEGLNSLF